MHKIAEIRLQRTSNDCECLGLRGRAGPRAGRGFVSRLFIFSHTHRGGVWRHCVLCFVLYCIYIRCVPGHNYSVTVESLRRHISTSGDAGRSPAQPHRPPKREGWRRVRWSGCNRVGSTAAVPTCSMVHALRPSTRVPASSHCRHPPRRRRHRRCRHLRCAPAPSPPRAPSRWPRPPSRRRASSCASQSTCKRSRGKMWLWWWWWWGGD